MTETTFAQLSTLSAYSAIGVLTLAMFAYAIYLARIAPDRTEHRVAAAAPERELVGAGAPTAGDDVGAGPDADAAPAEPVESPGARKAAGVGWMLTLLGTVLVVAAVVLRAAEVSRWPLGNMYEFALAGAMFTLLGYVGWASRRDLRWLGVFVVVPVLVVLGTAETVWYTEASQLMPSLQSYWLAIHVTVATMSVAVFTIGAALGGLYLVQDRLESQGGSGSFMSRLPAARRLERLSYMVHVVAFPLWTFTVIVGAIWARQAWGSYWNWDPKEVWSFVIWVVYAAYLHARATTGWKRQNATWIALAGFVCVIVNFAVVNVYFVGQHSYSGL